MGDLRLRHRSCGCVCLRRCDGIAQVLLRLLLLHVFEQWTAAALARANVSRLAGKLATSEFSAILEDATAARTGASAGKNLMLAYCKTLAIHKKRKRHPPPFRKTPFPLSAPLPHRARRRRDSHSHKAFAAAAAAAAAQRARGTAAAL